MSGIARGHGKPRAADLWGLAFSAMVQQKVRSVLTLIGIVVGTFALALSLAVGRGVDRAILNLFHEDDRLRKVMVNSNYVPSTEDMPAERREPKGQMSDAKRVRIRMALKRTWDGPYRHHIKLNAEAVRKLAAIEHVAAVVPVVQMGGKAILDGKSHDVQACSVAPDLRYFSDRLIAGRMLAPDDGRVALVHEYLLYRWGLVGDADAESAVGRRFRMEIQTGPRGTIGLTWLLHRGGREVSDQESRALESALKKLAALVRFMPFPAGERDALRKMFERVSETSAKKLMKTYTEEFTIVGVLREHDEKDRQGLPIFGDHWTRRAEVLLPAAAASAFVNRVPEWAEEGYESIVVTVDREEAVKEVARQVKKLGFQEFSFVEFIALVRMNVLLITMATAFVAVIALVVAAIGITNTMIMSVLERTREIGIMKALGARDRHIRLIFVVEGVLMGLIGSGLGLLLAWLASFPGDSFARGIMEPQMAQQMQAPVKGTLFLFPIWLVAGVPGLVSLITTAAAWYPASRAARVDPVTSLRHE